MSNPPPSQLSAMKLALLASDARAQHAALLRAEPIAIVGMSCRFPGNANSPEEFWQLLRGGVDAVVEIPPTRWDLAQVYDPDPAAPGKTTVRHAGLLQEIDGFDAAFFGILPREAQRMDPQQRIFLEVATDALDRSGCARERLAGSRTGVYVASYHNDYAQLQYADPEWIDSRTLTGTLHSVVANRLSYHLDLRGPSVSLDSACSSSLVAVHLACQGLRSGETDLAIAGGVSILASPELMISLAKVGFTSVAGRCRTFDAAADGFVRGEGCGVVVLKRLSDAVAAGDRILSVVRSSVVNQDGHTTVMAAPNGLAQRALIREALEVAGIPPARVGFLEAHGTGTPLGDPIEVEALASTVGVPRTDGSTCFLGSAKANIGHLEAAAGVVGLIKATLALQHAEIPPQIHFQKLNPHLSLAGTCLRVPTAPQPWAAGSLPRVAGISSFGAGGTNAHVILEEAPRLPDEPASDGAGPFLLPLSAQSPTALSALARRWVAFLEERTVALGVGCATAGERRSHYDYRLALVGATREEMRAKLQAHLDGRDVAGLVAGGKVTGRPRIAFVFAGQGSQWLGMGRELMAREEVFKQTIRDIDARISRLASWSLLAELEAPAANSRLDETEITQPAIFVIQVALCALWRSWGIVPDAVVGHSIGELAALHVAGAMSLDEATRVVVCRARALQRATGLGAMASVALDESEARALVRPFGRRLSLGALNSPRGVVLSGEREALSEVLAALDARGVQHRMLPVNYAFHSAQVAGIASEFGRAIEQVETRLPEIPVYSTVTGSALAANVLDRAFFERNVRDPVRFAPAVQAMLEDGFTMFLEIGPHPVLSVSLAECASTSGKEITLAASMRRERPERETALQACAAIYAAGRAPGWERVNNAAADSVDLPAYPWEHTRYWLRPRTAHAPRPAASDEPGSHELLGAALDLATTLTFTRAWPASAPQWLEDHRVGGRIVVPAAAMLDSLRAAAARALRTQAVRVLDFLVREPLVLGEDASAPVEWQVSAHNLDHRRLALRLHARTGSADWRLIASAEGERQDGAPESLSADTGTAGDASESPSPDALYASFAQLGMGFGPRFRTVRRMAVYAGGAEALLKCVHDTRVIGDEAVHATILDGALQVCVAAAVGESDGLPGTLLLPIGVDRYTVYATAPEEVRAVLRFVRRSVETIEASISLFTLEGTLVAQIDGARFARASAPSVGAPPAADSWLHEIHWRALASVAAPRGVVDNESWLVFVDPSAAGDRLCAQLAALAHSVVRVSAGARFARLDAQRYVVDPKDPQAFDTLLEQVSAGVAGRALRILHLWSLGAAAADSATDDIDLLTGGSALHLVQAVLRKPQLDTRLAFFTRGAQGAGSAVPQPFAAGLWGFARAAGAEFPELDLRIIDLDPDSGDLPVDQMIAAVRSASPSRQFAFRGGRELGPRISRLPAMMRAAPDVRLESNGGGTLDALKWRPVHLPRPANNEVRLRVHAAGLNFRDVLLALGDYHGTGEVPLGAECAGVIEEVGSAVRHLKPNDRVFGIAPAGLAMRVNVPARFLAPVPDGLTMERAAALPVAYLTVIYGLQNLAGLRSGMRILIHAATGGVGLAAVHWARLVGAEIFATAGSPAKRDLLRSMGVTHVFDSRSVEFAERIREATRGEGVEVVVNSLAGEFIPASFGVLAAGGCFLELGKRGIWSPEEAARARPDARYRAYDLGAEMLADHALAEALMSSLVSKIACKELVPLPVRVFGFEQAGAAFRFMAQARHVGKLVLKFPRTAQDESAEAPLARADATYLLTGGLGGLGARTARWLVRAGARHIVLTGRHPPGADARQLIAECEAAGASVCVRSVDAGDEAGMRALFVEIADRMPLLRGIVHAAGTLDDGVIPQQSWSRWQRVLRGKAHGARILHTLSVGLPLDFFILYSAAGLLLGPRGQAAYAAASAELDALAESRRASGLTALSVAWGQWSEAGMAAATSADGRSHWSARGLQWISPADGFARLESLIRQDVAYAAVLPIDWQRFAAAGIAAGDRDFFSEVLHTAVRGEPSAAAGGRLPGVIEHWTAAPETQRRARVLETLRLQALNVLGLPESHALDPRAPLKDAGLDSLMAVELRNVLNRLVGRTLPATLLFDYPSLDALATHLMRALALESVTEPASAASDDELAVEVASLTDEEAEAELLAELSQDDARSAS